MARKHTASDLLEMLGAMNEELAETTKAEVRQECASALKDMLKDPSQFAAYVGDYSSPDHRGVLVEHKSYLKGVKADQFEVTKDFRRGIEFAISMLADSEFEF